MFGTLSLHLWIEKYLWERIQIFQNRDDLLCFVKRPSSTQHVSVMDLAGQ